MTIKFLAAVLLFWATPAIAGVLNLQNTTQIQIDVWVKPTQGGWESSDKYSSSEMDYFKRNKEETRKYTVKPGASLSITCGWCTRFDVDLGWYYLPQSWQADTNYRISGNSPVFRIENDLGEAYSALAEGRIFYTQQYFFQHSLDHKIVLHKSGGYWQGFGFPLQNFDEAVRDYRTVDLAVDLAKRAAIFCGGCRGTVDVVSIDGKPVNYHLQDGGHYEISESGLLSSVRPPPETMPAEPPQALGVVYLVNGWHNPVRVLLTKQNGESTLKTLSASEGKQVDCGATCSASISTNGVSVRRALAAGRNYIIGLDRDTALLDITTYGGK